MKAIKRAALVVLALVVLMLAGIVVLVLTLDANLLKPVLQKAARDQGADLVIAGDLEWKFYPNIGLNLGELQVLTLSDKQPLASITGAAVSVKLLPLLRDRAILVNGIMLDGLNAEFNVDQNGESPWSQLGTHAAPTEEPAAEEQALPTLEVDSIAIRNLNLHYSNAQTGDDVRVRDTSLNSTNFSLTGRPFELELRSTIIYNDQPAATLHWQGPVAVNMDEQVFSTEGAKLSANFANAELRLELNNRTHFGDAFTTAGTAVLQPVKLGPLFTALGIEPPETSNPQVLQQAGLSTSYTVDESSAVLTDTVVQLDDIRLQGELRISNFEQPQIVTRWQGNSLALDDYLPPPAEQPSQTEPSPPTALPIEALQSLNLDATIAFEQISTQGLNLEQPTLHVQAKDGLIELEKLAMNVAGGSIAGTGRLDARQSQAKLAMQVSTKDVNLGQLLKTFAELDNITGSASASIDATSVGATDTALIDNLVLTAVAQSESLSLVPFNIEEQFCKALALVQQEIPKNFDWPAMTKLEPVTMELKFSEQTLQIDRLSAEIASLLGAAQGQFSLASGDFNVPFNLSIGSFATTSPGCLPIKEKWRKRALPLRCKGNINNIGPTTCLPDTKLIGDMIKDKLKGEAKEKLEQERAELKQKAALKQDQVEQKLEDKTRELVDKELGSEQTKELESKLKGALNRFKGKEPAKTSAPATE